MIVSNSVTRALTAVLALLSTNIAAHPQARKSVNDNASNERGL